LQLQTKLWFSAEFLRSDLAVLWRFQAIRPEYLLLKEKLVSSRVPLATSREPQAPQHFVETFDDPQIIIKILIAME